MDPEYDTEQAALLLQDAIATNAAKTNETPKPVYAINVRSTFTFTKYVVSLTNFFTVTDRRLQDYTHQTTPLVARHQSGR